MLLRGVIIAAGVFITDRLSKWWIVNMFANSGEGTEITPFLNIVFVMNTGVSFGLLQSDRTWVSWAFIFLAISIVIFLFIWLTRAESLGLAGGISLVLGGAIGNIVDRANYGAVIDFIDVHWGGLHWPAFNVADSAIVVGVTVIIIHTLIGSREKRT